MELCKNCGTTFEGKFCPNCSQKAATHRFTVRHLAHDIIHAVTHTDKGILFLIKELFRRPGRVALEYNAGKRKKYFNPITFLLLMLALQTFLSQKTDIYTAFNRSILEFAKQSLNSESTKKVEKSLNEADKATGKMLEYSKIVNFVFIPFIALLTWFMFKKSGHNYAESLILNIMVFGELCFLFIVFCLIPFMIFPTLVLPLMYIYLLISFIYSFIAYKQFFNQRWGITILKGILIQFVYIILVQSITSYTLQFL
jgi:hypothetical protein